MILIKRISLLLSVLLLFSCNNSGNQTGKDGQGPEYTSAYICPMHCEGSGSSEPGTCPVCGMDYVKNPDL
jgi:hypothetical protein